MDFSKLSDNKLFELYMAMHERYHNDILQESYKEDGIPRTIMNLYGAISERWYMQQQVKRAPLKVGDEVWYADKSDSNIIDRGIVASVYYKDGVLESIGVDFPDTKDFDEFYGTALNTNLFRTKEDAQIYLTQNQ